MKRIVITLLLISATVFGLNAQEYHLGQVITNPDGSKGVVFYLSPDGTSGWMVALHDAALSVPWGAASGIEGLPNITPSTNGDVLSTAFADTSGYANTLAIINHYQALGYSEQYAAGTVDIDNGWYLPAAGQLKMLYVNAVFYEPYLETVGDIMGLQPYWSSTQMSDEKAWYVHFGAPYPQENWAWNGNISNFTKSSFALNNGNLFAVRPIRNLDFKPLPVIGQLEAPVPICYQGPLELVLPSLSSADSYGWEIAEEPSFSNPIAYTGQELDLSHDGWYLRFWATNEEGTRYSNTVQITVEGHPVSEIHGQQEIFYFVNDLFTYNIDTVPEAIGYEWHIDNSWPLAFSPDSPQCSVKVSSKGQATLSVRVYTKCGFIERSILIRHDLEPGVKIYPNPNNGKFNIDLFGLEGRTLIDVHDYLGQLIDRIEVQSILNGLTVPYSLSGKAAGVYVITITNGYEHYNKKVIKESGGSYGIIHY